MYVLADAAADKTATGTIWLAIATGALVLVTIGVTFWQNYRDSRLRKQDKELADKQAADERVRTDARLAEQRALDDQRRVEDRQAADLRLVDERDAGAKQLQEEREIAERRITEERVFAASERVRERQSQRAASLMERVAKLRTDLHLVRNMKSLTESAGERVERDYLRNFLVYGAHVDAPLLGNVEVEKRYRNLVHLVLTLTDDQTEVTDGNVRDLRNYAKFVKLSLIALVDGTEIPKNKGPEVPFVQRAYGDGATWHPTSIPANWDDESSLDPNDPHFRQLP